MSSDADKEMRSYLLGTLDTALKTQLEERFLHSPEAYEELLIVEQELIDQYLAGGLSELERQQFENHFLTTAERQSNLRFGELLKTYLATHQVEDAAAAATHHVEISAPAPKPFTFSPPLFAGRPWMALCLAGVVVVGIVLLCCLAFRRPPAGSVHDDAEPVIVVSLAPGSINSGSDTTMRVNAPPKGYNLKIELELKNTSFNNYRFELLRENKPVQTSVALPFEAKGQQYVIPLTITGTVLSPGDYQVKLSGVLESGANEFIENYSFRVIE